MKRVEGKTEAEAVVSRTRLLLAVGETAEYLIEMAGDALLAGEITEEEYDAVKAECCAAQCSTIPAKPEEDKR